MSIIVRVATLYSSIIFLQAALHVSDDTLIHHQECTQTVITTSGTVRTVFALVCCRGGPSAVVEESELVLTPPRQRKVANTVQPVPDVVITV